MPATQQSNLQPFECDEPDDDDDDVVESRFNFVHRVHDTFTPEDDDYESVEVCATRNKTIYPQRLNNIHNQLTTVVNGRGVVQAIETEECV